MNDGVAEVNVAHPPPMLLRSFLHEKEPGYKASKSIAAQEKSVVISAVRLMLKCVHLHSTQVCYSGIVA